jgi:hypothetical protein
MQTFAEHPLVAGRADPMADRGQSVVDRRKTFFAHFRLAPAAADPQLQKTCRLVARGAGGIPSRFDPASSFYAAAGKEIAIGALAPIPAGSSLNAWMETLAAAIEICCHPAHLKPSLGPGHPPPRTMANMP